VLVDENAQLVRELEDERAVFRAKLAKAGAAPRVIEVPIVSATPAIPVVPVPVFVPKVPVIDSGLMNKLIAAEKRNTELLRRVTALETELSSKSAQINPDLSSVLEERGAQLDVLRGKNARLEAVLIEERSKRASLEAQIVALKSNASTASGVGILLTQELEKQVKSLGIQNDNLREQLEKQARTLGAENDNLRQELASVKAAEPKVIIKEIIKEVIKEVVKEVPIAATGTPEQVVALNERLMESETSALSLKAERDEYRALLQRERQRLKEMSDLGQKVSSVGATSNNMISEIQKLEAEKVDLIRQLEFSKAGGNVSTAAETASIDRAAEKRLETVTKESDAVKQQLRDLATEKRALEDRLRTAEVDAVEAKRALSNAKIETLSQDSTDVSDIRILEGEIASLEAQNRVLREDLAANAGRAVVAVDRAGSETMIAALEEKYNKRLEVMTRENIRLTQELNQKDKKPTEAIEITEKSKVILSKISTPVIATPVTISAPQKVAEGRVSPNDARKRLRARIADRSKIAIPAPTKAVETAKKASVQVAALAPVVRAPLKAPAPAPKKQKQVKTVAKVIKSVPVKVAAVAPTLKKQPAPIARVKKQPAMVTLSGDEIRQLVAKSQIPLVTSIERVPNMSGPDFAAFRWDTGTVYGSAEQSKLAHNRAFEKSVSQYISKTENRCGGEFDKTLIPVSTANGLTARAADIACVQNGNNGAVASILFFAHNGMFYALAHEGGLSDFQTAMDHRDRLVNGLSALF
ncbi:MAG: hypothetical protein COB76_05675, partial [Alphaproteobacteria bacterium]